MDKYCGFHGAGGTTGRHVLCYPTEFSNRTEPRLPSMAICLLTHLVMGFFPSLSHLPISLLVLPGILSLLTTCTYILSQDLLLGAPKLRDKYLKSHFCLHPGLDIGLSEVTHDLMAHPNGPFPHVFLGNVHGSCILCPRVARNQ